MFNKLFFCSIMLSVISGITLAKPYIPEHESEVLQQLPKVFFQAANIDEIKQLKAILSYQADNWPAASELAHHYIDLAHEQADPRYMGYAQAVLKPWWLDAQAPAQALIMRAIIKQYEHNFQAALTDLNQLLLLQPYHIQANLIKATIATVQGNYQTAVRHCRKLLRKSSLALAIACQSTPASLSGNAASNYRLLKQVLPVATGLDVKQQTWAWTALAEIAWRLGEFDAADLHFQTAMKTSATNSYLLKVYSDYLLQQRRPLKVIQLLTSKTQNDALLLRLTIAEKMTQAAATQAHITLLQQRFDANRQRGSNLHQGDEARFTLIILNKPQPALLLAQQNWQIQRESSDTYILLQAALAASDWNTVQQTKTWLSTKGTHDVLIKQLLVEAEEYEI